MASGPSRLPGEPATADRDARAGLDETGRAKEDARRGAARLAVLAEASHAFAEVTLDYHAVLERVASRARELIGDAAAVTVLQDDGVHFRVEAFSHPDPALARAFLDTTASRPFLAGEGFSGRVIAADAPAILVLRPGEAEGATKPEYRELVGRMRIHALAIAPMRAQGRVIGTISLQRERADAPFVEADLTLLSDLADRAALAIDSATLHAALDRRVRERTAQLEAALSELEAFSYSVSHDLRAPLRAIDGFGLALLEDFGPMLPEEAKGYLHRMRAATGRMGRLIDDLIELSRVTRQEMRREPVDLSGLARAALEELRRSEPGRQVDVSIAEGLVADADPRLLRVALDNLLGNAWKFSSRTEGARIDVGVRVVDREAVFFVRDNGAGFDMAYGDKLFGAFQRLHAAGDFPGTGIGLATVHRIVQRHGGRIWAESRVGAGATFFFTLGP
jgi:signal transduction histidine kinase